jgi:2-dehydro-3-deoxyphosphogluconate aldolase/(4S)-4-hydroxy-2-oxoglutarate aldolase
MLPLFDPELGRRISDCGIVAVLILDRVEDAVQVARSLISGGINAIELTFRTPVALEALKEVRAKVPEMIAGAGTILTVDQVRSPRKRAPTSGWRRE